MFDWFFVSYFGRNFHCYSKRVSNDVIHSNALFIFKFCWFFDCRNTNTRRVSIKNILCRELERGGRGNIGQIRLGFTTY